MDHRDFNADMAVEFIGVLLFIAKTAESVFLLLPFKKKKKFFFYFDEPSIIFYLDN